MAVFCLSIQKDNVSRILSGNKRWEFRANPRFGCSEEQAIKSGDTLVIISVNDEDVRVSCAATIGRILRKQYLHSYFGDPGTGHWLEAGCAPDSQRDWEFFAHDILENFSVAVELKEVRPLPQMAMASIVHQHTGRPWRGLGLTPLDHLHRFTITHAMKPLVM